ncbi:MAG: hypothetical protein ACOCU4_07520 [Alkalispirochaeta sp.]
MDDTTLSVIDRSTVDLIVADLRDRPRGELREIDRIYRRLLREVHPDRFGDDGALFMYVREQFSSLRAEWSMARARSESAAAVDRTRLLRDLGLPRDLAPRPALLASLYRFRSLGLAHYRVRSRPTLRRRNALIIRTVVAWAYEYDPGFVQLFYRFLRDQGNFGLSEGYAPLYFMVRKLVLKSLDGLIRYQDRPRPATAEIARDQIRYALEISRVYGGDPAFAAVHAFARWIGTELSNPPEPIGLDR